MVVEKQLIKEQWDDADLASFETALDRAIAEALVFMAPNGYSLTDKGILQSRR